MPNSPSSWKKTLVAVGAATAALTPLAAVPAQAGTSAEASVEVLASGLHNPRDITALSDGTLLVAEAGEGLATCAAGQVCAGLTGSVYKVKGSYQARVVTGLPSMAVGPSGPRTVAAGPNQVLTDPGGGYDVLNSFGSDGSNQLRASLGDNAKKLGTLVRTRDGKVLADLTDHETTANPDGGGLNANPWNMVRYGSDYLITDAGGNSVVHAASDGTTTTAFVVPSNDTAVRGKVDAVPTGLVRAPDGTLYGSDMSGTVPGAARIWKAAPGHQPEVLATGLSSLVDLAVDSSGNLIALSYTKGTFAPPIQPGVLSRINTRTGAVTEIPTGDQLHAPTGLALGPSGQIYVTNNTTGTEGQLVRVRP